ncbi:18498_t:CDS:2, partial [Funneliformis geosporum]
MSWNHEYFERNPETWGIIDFLNECEVEPYDAKIDKYTKSLKAIANDKQGERTKKAQSLLDSFMLVVGHSRLLAEPQNWCWRTGDLLGYLMPKAGLQPDRTKAKEWERKRTQKQVHIHQPNLNAGTVINGGTVKNINGEVKLMSKRDQNESDDDFQHFQLPKKRKKQLSLSKKNKESVGSAISKKAKTTKDMPLSSPDIVQGGEATTPPETSPSSSESAGSSGSIRGATEMTS